MLKKKIKLRDLIELKYQKDNTFIGLCVEDQEEEVMEIFRKKELILYLHQKLRKLAKKLVLRSKEVFSKANRLNEDSVFDPRELNKYNSLL